ncbi:MAG: transglycosylase SLT domain-containing protein [Acidobacteriota bacterium]
MSRNLRQLAVGMTALVLLALVLTLLALADSPLDEPVHRGQGHREGARLHHEAPPSPGRAASATWADRDGGRAPSSVPLLPWEPLSHPDTDIALISSILHERRRAARQKLAELSRLADNPEEAARVRGLAAFGAGVLLLELKRRQEAVERFLSPRIADTELGGHALYWAGEVLEETRPAQALEVLLDLVRAHPDFAHIDEARLRLGRVLAGQGSDQEALRQYQSILAAGRSEVRDEALMELAETLIDLGRREEAVARLEELYYGLPTSRLSDKAGGKLSSLRKKLPPMSEEETYRLSFQRAVRLEEAGEYRKAFGAYAELLRRFPSRADRQLIELRRGVCQYWRRQSRSAERRLRRVERPELKPEALYFEALSARRLRKRKTYVRKMEAILALAPQSPWAQEALWSLARYFRSREEVDQAHAHYRRLADAFPRGKHVLDARWWVLWEKYRLGLYEEAAAGLESSARAQPGAAELDKFLFWAGRSLEKLQQRERAEALYRQVLLGYRNSYYGRRAWERLARLRGERAPTAILEESRRGMDLGDALGVLQTDRQTRVGQLMAVGLHEEARLEAERGVRGEADGPAFLALLGWLHFQEGHHLQAFATLREAFPFHVSAAGDLLPRQVWQILYPLKYWDLVHRYAADQQLDPYLVAGLIRQESTFDPKVRSRAGARGLMQIMPSTARKLARQLRRRYRLRDLYEPEVSIRYGTLYLRQILDRFRGRVVHALASYNAGPHRVKGWAATDPDLDADEFIEEIPFNETRNYVKLVLRNEMLYRRVYGEPTALAVEVE